MSKVSPNSEKVMKLLLEGKIEQARKFVEKDIAKQIEAKRAELTELNRERSVLSNMVMLQKGEQDATPTSTKISPPQKRVIPKEERSVLIKQYAHEAARQAANQTITLQAVVDQLEADGIDLGTDVPGTAIGNVLFKSNDWRRIERGIFQYVGAQLDLRH